MLRTKRGEMKWTSRVLIVAVMLLGGKLVAAASPPDQGKADAIEPAATFRAYLPTIRLKALLDHERQSVADLEDWLRTYDRWLEGGLVNQIQRGQIEEEFHRSRLRALRLDTDYRDSLDQFTSRFNISAEHRRQMEDTALSPLTMHLPRFEEFSRDSDAAAYIKAHEVGGAEDVAKVRAALVKILTESALVKNTTLPDRFLKSWGEWKKLDDRDKLLDRITKDRKDLAQIRIRQVELAGSQQELPEADRQRREALKFESDLGEFQLGLLRYEKQPWKNGDNNLKRLRDQREAFFDLLRIFRSLLDYAYVERFGRLVQSWPGLAPVKVKDVDLLACKADIAEESVTSLLKTPDAQLTARKKVRHVRKLAESYRIQQQLFRKVFQQRQGIKHGIASSPEPRFSTVDRQAGRDRFGSPTLPETIREYSQARRQLLQTWTDYQMVRLDLYSDLGLSPPAR